MTSFTSRRLPHVYSIGQPLFVTFRLHGSLPQGRHHPNGALTSSESFACMDGFLDRATYGPLFLRIPEIARIVANSIEQGGREGRYASHAWVIMPNHVHFLMTPHANPAEILRRLKGATARQANLQLNRQGTPFWQRESYDRLVRDPNEFRQIERYIVLNPVKAGIAASPEQCEWSSAWEGRQGGLKSAAS